MLTFPLFVRRRRTGGEWSDRVLADDAEQARGFLAQWRNAGFTEFDIEDADGQLVVEADIR